MKQVVALGIYSIGSCCFLTGCGIAPGMHMNNTEMTPTPNDQNQILSPKVIQINAHLIITERKRDKQALEEKVRAYAPPEGFFTQPESYNYTAGPGDVLNIVVYNHPEFDSSLTHDPLGANSPENDIAVNHQGFIYYPYLGYINVRGKTTHEIREILATKLSQDIKNPQVNVRIKEFNSHQINITGDVKNPTTINLTEAPLTLLAAVGQAKPNECSSKDQICADLEHVQVTQNGISTTVNLKTLAAVDGSSANWILTSGAVVRVPNNSLYQIYTIGGVLSPGSYRMLDDSMSLREAIGRAGGASNLSDPGYTYVVRNYGNDPKVYMLNLRSPDAFNIAGEFYLMPQDVVFVSTSKLQTFNEVLNQITPTLTNIAVIKSISD